MAKLSVALLFFSLAVLAAPARAATRSIAVLEFRAGTSGIKNAGARLAAILKKGTSRRVVDATEARRLAGAGIDEAVARCGGEAGCIAGIGRKLGVDEVLLVGISDLGDVILALQLVDARDGRAVARAADSFPQGAEPDEATLEGYLKRVLPPEDFLRWGTLRIVANVDGAVVEIGGKPQGVTPLARPLTIAAPRAVDVRLSKEGYGDFRARIDILPESTVEVRPMLTRASGSAWYQKWWVWAIAGAVVAGGVTTAIVLSQPGETNVPLVVRF